MPTQSAEWSALLGRMRKPVVVAVEPEPELDESFATEEPVDETRHASLAVWLTRLTGQRDIVIVAPVIGRDAAEVEPLIGFFLTMRLLMLEAVLRRCVG